MSHYDQAPPVPSRPDPIQQAGRTVLPPQELAEVISRVQRLVPPLAKAVWWLRWPSLVLLAIGAAGPVLLASLALTWQGWPKVAGLIVAAVAVVPTALFGRSRLGTLRAAHQPAALTAQLTTFVTHLNGPLAMLDTFETVIQRGGLLLIPRLRALWAVVSLPGDVLDDLQEQSELRWLVPPVLMNTWARLIGMCWTTVGCYILTGVLGALSLTPVL